jgi:hypothetical protein
LFFLVVSLFLFHFLLLAFAFPVAIQIYIHIHMAYSNVHSYSDDIFRWQIQMLIFKTCEKLCHLDANAHFNIPSEYESESEYAI